MSEHDVFTKGTDLKHQQIRYSSSKKDTFNQQIGLIQQQKKYLAAEKILSSKLDTLAAKKIVYQQIC